MADPMADELVTPELLRLIGREWDPVTYEVERPGIRMWARAVGIDDLVYYEDDEARARGFEGMPAPPGYVGSPRTRPGAPSPGPPVRGLHPDLKRSLNAGTEFEYRASILAGDQLVATTRIVDIQQRNGSLGKMLLISRETTYRRDDEIVAIMRATVINY
jgi:N-terminal half of MaoC dehydratase